jgi:hypothetical protein
MTALLPKPRVKLVKQGKQYTYEDMLRWLVDVEAQTVKQYLLKDDEFLLQNDRHATCCCFGRF